MRENEECDGNVSSCEEQQVCVYVDEGAVLQQRQAWSWFLQDDQKDAQCGICLHLLIRKGNRLRPGWRSVSGRITLHRCNGHILSGWM